MTRRMRELTMDLLRNAAALVELGWTQNVAARDAQQKKVSSIDERAVCWCARGALSRAAASLRESGATKRRFEEFGAESRAVRALREQLFDHGAALDIVSWNDDTQRTQSEIAGTLRKTADAVEAESARRALRLRRTRKKGARA